MPSLHFNSSTIGTLIKDNSGELLEKIDWCTKNSSFQRSFVTVNAKGKLTSSSPDRTLIHSLNSASIQILDDGIIFVRSFDRLEEVFLRVHEKSQFPKLFAALIFWQSLRPRGLSYKSISSSFDDYAQNSENSLNSNNLLVAYCKIYGSVPKVKNLTVIDGPDVSIYSEKNAGWFSAMVTLKSNGILQLINENDGQLLYSIDIKLLTRSEVRELHHSIFESSNYLFIGLIENLREETLFANSYKTNNPFIFPVISIEQPTTKRIILEFPYRIDVEDWLVALTSFTIRDYAGLDKSNMLRVSRKIQLDILEATLLDDYCEDGLKTYIEVQIWGYPWFRTSIVQNASNPFYRETFEIDLALTTVNINIILKKATSSSYKAYDTVLGSSVLTYKTIDQIDTFQDRISLKSNNSIIGKVFISTKNQKNYILPPENFNNFEQMILNLDYQEFMKFVLSKSTPAELETTSVTLLDIFQSAQREAEWFHVLIDEEVKSITNLCSKNNSTELYNTLFRGNSLLSKSLELYNLRIGQEYLEKVIGSFIDGVLSNDESYEMDPLRLQHLIGDEREAQITRNFQNLLKSVETLWKSIYSTSNDLPDQIKQQLTILRKKIEFYTIDEKVALNSVSAFLFLRFFCPVILNPKLFFLTKDHQTGDVGRKLALISKILMKLANNTKFGAKEPYLTAFNDAFIEKRQDELSEYLDNVTLKKLNFTPKTLKLSSSFERTDIILTSKELFKELPTVPFLIDKYLRIDQLVDLVSTERLDLSLIDDFGYKEIQAIKADNQLTIHQIGSLEFEKLVLEDSKAPQDFEFGSEKFIKTLLNTNETDQVYNYINSNSSLKDLIREADRITNKKTRLTSKLSAAESREDIQDLKLHVKQILSSTTIDNAKNVLKISFPKPSSVKTIESDTVLSNIKFKIPVRTPLVDPSHAQEHLPPLNSSTRSPKKRISNLIRSASLNTLQFSPSSKNLDIERESTKITGPTVNGKIIKHHDPQANVPVVEPNSKKKSFVWFNKK